MFDKLQSTIESVEKIGADFVDARYDELLLRTIIKENGIIRECKTMKRAGVGFNVFYQGTAGYAFSAVLSRDAMEEAAKSALGIAKSSAHVALIKADHERLEPIRNIRIKPNILEPAWLVEMDERLDILDTMESSANDHGKDISSLVLMYGEISGTKILTNSEGTEIHWDPYVLDIRASVTSKTRSGDLVTATDGAGGSVGLEFFKNDGKTPVDFGKNAALWAKEKIDAKAAPAGEFRALTDNGLSGVLAHESFGHLTEGDFIITKSSPIHDRIGEKLGSEHATIIDEGVVEVSNKISPYFLPYDDEGIKSQKVTLLENGVLTGYLNSRVTSPHSNGVLTGNARAINYTFAPIPRMKNTYFEAGDLTEEEALEQLGTGIYAIKTAGGQVDFSGTFLFKSVRGYWVENGEKQYPLKDVTLTGEILDFLNSVEGATSDMEMFSGYFGGCGKGNQFPLPVGIGGPKLLISKVRFGGEIDKSQFREY